LKPSFSQELGQKMVPGGGALSVHRGPDNVFFASPLWRRERKTEGDAKPCATLDAVFRFGCLP
jgi:hypothetical protein